MKVSRLFTIDVDIAERLKQLDNQSTIVNRLLKEYFEVRSDKSSLLDEKTAVLEQVRKKKSNSLRILKLLMSSIRLGLIILLSDGWKLVRGSRAKQK